MAIKDLNSKVDLTTYTAKVNELQNSINTKANTTVASTSANGLMSSADKTKLNGIATNANNYVHPTTSGNKHIPSGGTSGQVLKWSADGTAVWANDNNTTYGVATTSANGLMSSADKTKLNGIATNANNYVHPTSSGNKHIPSGGLSGQFLKWSADGTAVWANDNNTTYTAGTGLTLSGTTFSANIGTGSGQVAAGNHTHNYLPLSGVEKVTVSTSEINFTGGTLFNKSYFGGGMITLRQKDTTEYDKCMLELYAHQRGSIYLGANDSSSYRIETNMSNGFMFNSKINVPKIQVGSEIEAVNGHLILKGLTTGAVQVESELGPRVDNKYFLGVDSYRWRAVYSAGGFIQSSDMRMKSDIRDIDDNIFFNLIKNTGVHSYVLNYPDMPEDIKQEEAPQEQVHVGIIAQEMAQYDGHEYILNVNSEGHYSVNNYNLVSAIMAALKVEITKREQLELEIEKLKILVNNLQN